MMKLIKIILYLGIAISIADYCPTLLSSHYRPPKLTREMRKLLRKGRKTYLLSLEPIDVVFVCHPKDVQTLNLAIEGIRKNGKNIRRIIVVSAKKLTDLAEWFDETAYPFTKKDIALTIFNDDRVRAEKYIGAPDSRIGWIYQQFLKLYAAFVIPDISSNVLVVDADTIFLNETEFMDDAGNPLFNPGSEFITVYFEYGAKLLPGFKKIYKNYSGISHHMLFQRPILEDLFQLIQLVHNIEPWRAMAQCLDHNHLYSSALSEYELYFNFVMRGKQGKIRFLKWENMTFNEQNIKAYRHGRFHYVSCHVWMNVKYEE